MAPLLTTIGVLLRTRTDYPTVTALDDVVEESVSDLHTGLVPDGLTLLAAERIRRLERSEEVSIPDDGTDASLDGLGRLTVSVDSDPEADESTTALVVVGRGTTHTVVTN